MFPMAVSRLNGYRPPLNWPAAEFARLFKLVTFRLFAFKSVNELAAMPFSADPFRNWAAVSLLWPACVAFGLIMLFSELVVFLELFSELDGLSVWASG